MQEIQAAYTAADQGTQDKILQKAGELTLVPSNTTPSDFTRKLSQAVDGNTSKITDKLNQLLQFTKSPG